MSNYRLLPDGTMPIMGKRYRARIDEPSYSRIKKGEVVQFVGVDGDGSQQWQRLKDGVPYGTTYSAGAQDFDPVDSDRSDASFDVAVRSGKDERIQTVDLGSNLRKMFALGEQALLSSGWPGFTSEAVMGVRKALEALVQVVMASPNWSSDQLNAVKLFGRCAWETSEKLIAGVRWHETGLDDADREALAEARLAARGLSRDEYVQTSPDVASLNAQIQGLTERTHRLRELSLRWESASVDDVLSSSQDPHLQAAATEAERTQRAADERADSLTRLARPLMFGRAAYDAKRAALEAELLERREAARTAQQQLGRIAHALRESAIRTLAAEVGSLSREREALDAKLALARKSVEADWVKHSSAVQAAQNRVAELQSKGTAVIEKARAAAESAHTFMMKCSHVWGFVLANGLQSFPASTEPDSLRRLSESGICEEFGSEELSILREAFALSNQESFQALIEILAQHFLAFIKLPKTERRTVAAKVATPWVEFIRCEGFLSRLQRTPYSLIHSCGVERVVI